MGDDTQKEEKQKSGNAFGAVITGAVVGAGVVMATQTVLKSEENRKKLRNAVDMAKDKAGEYASGLKDKVMSEKHIKSMLPKEKKAVRAVRKIKKKVSKGSR